MSAPFTHKKVLSLVGLLVFAGVTYLVKEYQAKDGNTYSQRESNPSNTDDTVGRTTDALKTSRGEEAILRAFRDGESDVIVELAATVTRTLADDNDGSRHQRFIVELKGGHTVLVAHNIDLADRVPLSVGDHIEIKGEYEYNQQGGVIHWTHHDPKQWREGGWIRLDGVLYE